MPKVINQTGVSVDSLQAKLTLLESKFSKLSTEHNIVLDSLQAVKETAMHAEISTTFYQSHLSTYTGLVSLIIALIAIIGWKSLVELKLAPIDKKVDNFISKEIPNLLDQVKEENQLEIKVIKEENSKTAKMAYSAIFWGLHSFHRQHAINKNYSYAFLYSLRIINVTHENFTIVSKITLLKEHMDGNIRYLSDPNFDPKILEYFEKEIEDIYDNLAKSNNELFSEFARKSRKAYYQALKTIDDPSIEKHNNTD